MLSSPCKRALFSKNLSFFTKSLLFVLLLSTLSACGYSIRGQEGVIPSSIIGEPTKTIKIQGVEQPTLHPWLPYFVRSVLRDEITERNIATWADSEETDFELFVNITDFQIRSYGSYAYSSLLTAKASLELTLFDGTSNEIVWKSGSIKYSETYESGNEEVALRELVVLLVQRAIDRLQQRF